MLPHTSPHCIVSIIPGVGFISVLQIRTLEGNKEKQGDSGLEIRAQPSPQARRHEEAGDKPRDTEPGRGSLESSSISPHPASPPSCMVLWGRRSSGEARKAHPKRDGDQDCLVP